MVHVFSCAFQPRARQPLIKQRPVHQRAHACKQQRQNIAAVHQQKQRQIRLVIAAILPDCQHIQRNGQANQRRKLQPKSNGILIDIGNAAALAAQAAAPNAFVLWHYTMQPDDTTPVTTVAHPAQQSDLARLHLDCLIAMPWNKLYRRTYARQLAFDQAYTLGEDLQFVLDYLALLGRCQPDFSYLVLESALTFYDCSRTGTLSTKYHANYCEIWPKHFAKLNAACTAAACPPQDMLPLHRAELQVLAEGAADILRRDPDAMPARRAKARTALQSPWLKSLLDTMRHEHCYSPYYLPCRWNSLRLLWMLSEAARTQSPLFGKLDWAGYYLLLGRMKRG